MNEERELRDRLEDLEVPPSRVEMDELLDAGRRREVRRKAGRAAAGAVLAVGVLMGAPTVLAGAFDNATLDVAPSASASTELTPDLTPTHAVPGRDTPVAAITCRVAELPVPNGLQDIEVTAVDPTGTYILGHAYAHGGYQPILWTGGKAEVLAIPGKSVQLTDVNAAGQVVGMIEIDNEDHPFRWADGAYQMLALPAGNWHAYPQPEINASGDVVLNVEPRGNSGGTDSFAIIWANGSTKAKKLPLPKGGNAHDLNDDGTVIGSIYKNGSADAGYVWDQQGRGHKLKNEAGQTNAAYKTRGDWVTGGLWPAMEPALWNTRTGQLIHLPTPAGADPPPAQDGVGPGIAVNSAGWVVAGPYVLLADGPLKLPVAKGLTPIATAVSDTGLVVGRGDTAGNKSAGPLTWQCST
ncbi:hypothetical protein GCM10010172_10220 [Paractinoplanes ferrugineus]|uniref:Uncharacterized protein n=1 Tax=Paractinoplanes ferrugineus TaxID=113564 RepID=A0A919M7M9_9ACTN|nr:hypothetical protein [Actinoplanes ferrugineus]GIE09586.1 hypothetical protein Afe05nite_14260 [Actinoplanes ferrugineus]